MSRLGFLLLCFFIRNTEPVRWRPGLPLLKESDRNLSPWQTEDIPFQNDPYPAIIEEVGYFCRSLWGHDPGMRAILTDVTRAGLS